MAEEDEGIVELAASIRRVGLLAPLVVRADGDSFVVIAGHRRLAACYKLAMESVRCIEAEGEGPQLSEISFAENLFRKDLSPVELAAGLKDCLEGGSMDIQTIAAGVHRTVDWVGRMISMLDWPADVLEAIHEGWLSVSAAHSLALVLDDTYRGFLLSNARDGGATARTTAAWLQAWRSMQPVEQAILAEPVAGSSASIPAVPQAPCICCSQVFRSDELSHVPVCVQCIRLIREVGTSR